VTPRGITFISFIACCLLVVGAAPALAYEWPESLGPQQKGPAVKALQVRVAGWYPDENKELFAIDGVFGDQTVAAVEAFQAHYGLPVDGLVGTAMFKQLDALQDDDRSTEHFDWSEFWQNRNPNCSKKANRFAGTFDGGRVEARVVKRNVRWVMWRLEALRAKLGDHPIGINSAFRSVAYNQCIGGASLSQHMYGTAADFKVLDVANRAARDAGKSSQFHGIACYSSLSHNHFDLRLQNKELEAAHYWWWPKRDKLERDLADDERPCWGEPKKEPGEQQASGAVMSGAALDDWKNAYEPFLFGAD
jgi:zinc D-Ala-D-Ala carboxypeptidase